MSGAEDDADLQAAEYVLGVLEGAEREEVVRRADRDDALGAAIMAWENRLGPLALIVPPVAPPAGLWQRVEISCGLTAAALSPSAIPAPARAPERRGFWDRLGVWRGMSALGFGLAAAIAVVAVINRPAPPAPVAPPEIPLASAILAPFKGTGAPGFIAEATPGQTLVIRPLQRLAVASNKDYELWALPDGTVVPKPLGVINVSGQTLTVPAALHGSILLLVSLEQKGGSPTGLPQGPVIWAGHIARLD
jgi:anti-sigma-K factor RskA